MRKYIHIVLVAAAVAVLGNAQTRADNLLSGGDFEPPGEEVPGWTLEQFATGSGTLLDTASVENWHAIANGGVNFLFLKPFVGGQSPGPDNLTNAILSQTAPGVAGETYLFTAHSRWEENWSGGVTTLAPAGPDASG